MCVISFWREKEVVEHALMREYPTEIVLGVVVALNVDVDEGKIDVDTVDVQEGVEDSVIVVVEDTVGETVEDSEIVGETVEDSEIVGEDVIDSEIVGVAENEQVELGVSDAPDDSGLTVTAEESVLVGENEEVSDAEAPRVVDAVGL